MSVDGITALRDWPKLLFDTAGGVRRAGLSGKLKLSRPSEKLDIQGFRPRVDQLLDQLRSCIVPPLGDLQVGQVVTARLFDSCSPSLSSSVYRPPEICVRVVQLAKAD
jgi:hypothetical protein